jgi:putative ABC transport system permease protein
VIVCDWWVIGLFWLDYSIDIDQRIGFEFVLGMGNISLGTLLAGLIGLISGILPTHGF